MDFNLIIKMDLIISRRTTGDFPYKYGYKNRIYTGSLPVHLTLFIDLFF
jgi:hypothetical protein